MIEEILRHLSHGWHGFIRIMARATREGVKLPEAEIERLRKMQTEIAEIIRQQESQTR